MCFIKELPYRITDKDDSNTIIEIETQIAEDDIEVYKIVQILDENTLVSIFRYFSYKKGEVYSTVFGSYVYLDFDVDSLAIDQGFHAYISKEKAMKVFKHVYREEPLPFEVVKFIIPKGSKYVLNLADEEVVSNQIKFV